jgi:hypothetical protein
MQTVAKFAFPDPGNWGSFLTALNGLSEIRPRMDVRRIAFVSIGIALASGCRPFLMPHPDDSRPTITAESTRPGRFAGATTALQITEPPAAPPKSPIQPVTNTVPAPLPELPELPSIPTTHGAAPKPLAPIVETQAAPPTPMNGVAALRELHTNAAKTYAKMDTYIMRLRRREVVAGSARPEELVLCKIRKEPFSVYMKWLDGAGKGREVTYVKDGYEGKIHSLTAPGDIPIFSGTVFSVAPDSPLVKSKSRYPITEAGIGSTLAGFDRLVTAAEKGDTSGSKLEYLGPSKRAEFAEPVNHVKQTIAPKVDPNLAAGGVRHWYFDATNGLPVLIVAYDEKRQEVEYYCHDRFQFPVRLDNDDFDPDKLFKKKK